ncbi:CoB--CoM heterodisulfide reductase iron-sulfur subunit B family protein [Candidatus Pyrohabitans sp.]
MGDDYLYFPGCNIPYRENQYELSARAVAEKLGIKLHDRPFNCCGLNTEPVDEYAALLFSARNIAIAEEEGMNLVALCNGCYKTLRVANRKLHMDERLRAKVNEGLSRIGREVKGTIEVYHMLELISDRITKEHMVKKVQARIAPFTGCHAVRPSEYVDFGAAERLMKMIKLAGGRVVRYRDMDKCCGAPLLALSEEMGISLARQRMLSMKERKAELAVTMCPFCQVSLDGLQVKAEQEFKESYDIPSLYITQLLGLAMGIKPEKLGINENKKDPSGVLARVLV